MKFTSKLKFTLPICLLAAAFLMSASTVSAKVPSDPAQALSPASASGSSYFAYDKLGRLESVTYASNPERNESYRYDRQGNITLKKVGDIEHHYTYDSANQLVQMKSPEGVRSYVYDRAGRLISESLNGTMDVEYTYGYLDKVIAVNRNGKVTRFAYDGNGMLAQKTLSDGTTETWGWDGMALIRRGEDIYVNEPHISGGTPLATKTAEGVRYHESDYLGTTLWSTDASGKRTQNYSDTNLWGKGSIENDRAARFTGKPYDADLQAYVFPFRNYDAETARWRSSDPSGYPDGINQHFYAAVPTMGLDPLGLWRVNAETLVGYPDGESFTLPHGRSKMDITLSGAFTIFVERQNTDIGAGIFYCFVELVMDGSAVVSLPFSFRIEANMNSIAIPGTIAIDKAFREGEYAFGIRAFWNVGSHISIGYPNTGSFTVREM